MIDPEKIIKFLEAISAIKRDDFCALSPPETCIFEGETEMKEYKLIEASRSNPSLYKGTFGDTYWFLEFLACDSYEQMISYKQAFDKRSILYEHIIAFRKQSEIFINNNYVFVIISPIEQCITLEEWNGYYNHPRVLPALKEHLSIRIDSVVKCTLFVINQIANLHKAGQIMDCLCPENIAMQATQNPTQPLRILGNVGFEVVVDPINAKLLKEGFPYDSIYPKHLVGTRAADFYGLGLCIYGAVSHRTLDKFPRFTALSEREIYEEVLKVGYIPGISELMLDCLRDTCMDMKADKLLFSSIARTWEFIVKTTGLDCSYNGHIKAVLSGVFFSDIEIYKRCTIMVSKFEIEKILKACLVKTEVIRKIIKGVTMFENFYSNNELSSFIIKFILRCLHGFPFIKSQAGELGIYFIMSCFYMIDTRTTNTIKEIAELIVLFSQNNTITGFWNSNYNDFIREITQYEACSILTDIFPYVGPISVSLIDPRKSFYCYKIRQIPIHFKRKSAEDIINSLTQYLRSSEKIDFKDIRFAAETVYQLTVGGPLHYEAMNNNECTHKAEIVECLPIVAKCDCGSHLCFSCAKEHFFRKHKLSYRLYFDMNEKICNCKLEHLDMPMPLLSKLGDVPVMALEPVSSRGNIYKSDSNNMKISSRSTLNFEHDFSEIKTLFYYEVEIISAGVSEDIGIGLDCDRSQSGPWILYEVSSGIIYMFNQNIRTGPRLGTLDTLGVGLTSNFIVFFTYNGYNLNIYIENQGVSGVIPYIHLRGEGIEVKVKFTDFLFGNSQFVSIDEERLQNLKILIHERARSLCKGKKKDRSSIRAREEVLKYLDIINM